MTSSEPESSVQKESKKRCYVSEVAKLLSRSLLSYRRSRLPKFSIAPPEIHDYSDIPDYKYDGMRLDFRSYLPERSDNDVWKTRSSLNAKQIEKSVAVAFRKFVPKLSLIMKSLASRIVSTFSEGVQKLWQPDANESFADDMGSMINEKHWTFFNFLRTCFCRFLFHISKWKIYKMAFAITTL